MCVGDGAEWIRRVFDDWFPDAEKVVDHYHAAEYLWAGKLRAPLKAGRLNEVLEDLRERGGDAEDGRLRPNRHNSSQPTHQFAN